MGKIIFLNYNNRSRSLRILLGVFGILYIVIGFHSLKFNYYAFIILGILQLLSVFVIGAKKNSYLMINDQELLYKKSFFQKGIFLEFNVITNISASDEELIIKAKSGEYKIQLSGVDKGVKEELLPSFISEIEENINC